MVNMAGISGMSEKKVSEAREHLREAEKWYSVCWISCCVFLILIYQSFH